MGKGRPTTDYYADMQMFKVRGYADWKKSSKSLSDAYQSYKTEFKGKIDSVSTDINQKNGLAGNLEQNKVDKGTCNDSLSEAVSKLKNALEKKADKTKYAGDIKQDATLEACLADAEKKVKEYKEKKDKEKEKTTSFDPVPSLSVTGFSASGTGASVGLTSLSISVKLWDISIYGCCGMVSGVTMSNTGVDWKYVTNKSDVAFLQLLIFLGQNKNEISVDQTAINDVGAALTHTSAGAVRTAVGQAMDM